MDSSLSGRHYIKADKSVRRSSNRSSTAMHSRIDHSDLSAVSTSRVDLPQKSYRTDGRNSFREAVQKGYVRPPCTVTKPFNLSRPNSKPHYDIENDQPNSTFRASKCPTFDKPFIVYRSDKPLTIPKSFHFIERKVLPTTTVKRREQTPEDILKRLRAKSVQKIVNQGSSKKEHSMLIQKFKEFSGKEINNLLHIQNRGFERRMTDLKENMRKNWK